MKSTIRLFKSVPTFRNKGHDVSPEYMAKSFFKTIPYGFIFTKEVMEEYSFQELDQLADIAIKEIGLSGGQTNNSFHKSWDKIRTSTMEQLVLEQIVHYITTYGYEALGVFDNSTVFIPCEKLEIPDLDLGKLYLTEIKGLTKDELKTKLVDLLSGIALKEDTIKDVVELATWLELDEVEIETIKNKEVRCILYDYLGKVPSNPTEFLRLCIYKATEKSLIIKSKSVIGTIKNRENKNIDILGLFVKYNNAYSLQQLGQIFFRFKPLFLAFKTNKKLNTVINKVRKLADRHHKPMAEDYLNNVTRYIAMGRNLRLLNSELLKVNVFRKIRLAYALKYRTTPTDSILYQVRNGKSFAKEFNWDNFDGAEHALSTVIYSIVENITKNVKGKKIFIPENITYALPATEKQFIGMLPCGTMIELPESIVVGVHWNDIKDRRIDLDFSLTSIDGKFGWDRWYRDTDRNILFSGDMTSASGKNGASELFYFKTQKTGQYLLNLNYFNFDSELPVPFSIFLAKHEGSLRQNYMVDPNNILFQAKDVISSQQKILGLLKIDGTKNILFLVNTHIGTNISANEDSDVANHAREYLNHSSNNPISLNDLLVLAGAELVDNKEDADIDLSPESLEKDTIINLIK